LGSGHRRTLGALAEDIAFRYLVDRGLRPVRRNYHCRGGEIDLIMQHGECLVFIEVRCRQSSAFSMPGHTVDRHKQRKIVRTAAIFLSRERRFANVNVRFDVVAIEGRSGDSVQWMRDAFRPDDPTL
jgi:putative endonuclease